MYVFHNLFLRFSINRLYEFHLSNGIFFKHKMKIMQKNVCLELVQLYTRIKDKSSF